MNLFSYLEDAARKWPECTALVYGDVELRYSELCSMVDSLVSAMRRTGVQAGNKVGLMCRGAERFAAFFAVLRLGAVVVSIPPELKPGEIISLAHELALDVICYNHRLKPLVPDGIAPAACAVGIFGDRAPLHIQPIANRSGARSQRRELLRLNAATIRFSSGTTATAKGIIDSCGALLARIEANGQIPPLDKDDCLLWLRSSAEAAAVYAALFRGARVVLANSLDVGLLRRLVAEHHVTHVHAVPLVYQGMLNEANVAAEDFHGVRHFVSTGRSLPHSTIEAFRAKFGREILQHYGLGECGKVLANQSEDVSKRGSVGVPVPGWEVKLVAENGDEVGLGTAAELLVRGPGLFEGYYQPWRLREEVLEDGWFRTGDLARRDADGYYWIVGRVKDVINVGGVKVFPAEIEDVLLSHPAVEETAVFGVREARFGEVPHAKVKLHDGVGCTEMELLRYANERLSVFKSLRSIEFVGEISKTATGKPRRWV